MNKSLQITAISLIVIVMGFGAVAPMIPQAEAIPEEACRTLEDNLSDKLSPEVIERVLLGSGCT